MPGLSMPLFVTPQDVIERMQLNPELNGIVDVITSGITAAELQVQSLLDSVLCRQSIDCTFYTDPESFSGIQPDGVYQLELPSGFIRQDTPVIITVADTIFGDYSVADATLVKIDYQRGYIYVNAGNVGADRNETSAFGENFGFEDDTGYGNQYIRVQCDTGFEPGTNPQVVGNIAAYDDTQSYAVGAQASVGGFVYTCVQGTNPASSQDPTNTEFWKKAFIPMEQIPPEVYDAIMSYVPIVLNSNQTVNKDKDAADQYKAVGDHSNLILKQYLRIKGFSFRARIKSTGPPTYA